MSSTTASPASSSTTSRRWPRQSVGSARSTAPRAGARPRPGSRFSGWSTTSRRCTGWSSTGRRRRPADRRSGEGEDGPATERVRATGDAVGVLLRGATTGRRGGRSPGPVVDRDVVGQARSLEVGCQGRPRVTEGGCQERPSLVDLIERPEAVDDPNAEAAREERAVPPAPGPVLRQLAAQLRDVVAAVVVNDEQATLRPE